MTVKGFGTLLIVIGVFSIFALFAFCEWNVNLNFIENIRYAHLYEIVGRTYMGDSIWRDPINMTLGQGLLIPLLIVGVGVLLNRKIINPKFVSELLPFLNDENPDARR